MVGIGVLEGSRVGSTIGAGVQVGGSENRVAVGEGTMIVGGRVGRGKGLSEESGLMKIARKSTSNTSVAVTNTIVSISQMESFIFFLP